MPASFGVRQSETAGIYNVNEGGTIKPVYVNNNGQLGMQPPASSRRFKKEIKPMDQTSEAILGLKPVTFHYKDDSAGPLGFKRPVPVRVRPSADSIPKIQRTRWLDLVTEFRGKSWQCHLCLYR